MQRQSVPIQGNSVLLVDDDIDLLLTWQELLQAHNYQILTAQTGTEALKMMKEHEVDAILCDLDIPELSGDLFYIEVGRAWPQLLKRFIFITGHAGNPAYDSFLKNAKAPVLSKPLSVDLLVSKLQAVLSSPTSSPA